jgi:hypothetical protein
MKFDSSNVDRQVELSPIHEGLFTSHINKLSKMNHFFIQDENEQTLGGHQSLVAQQVPEKNDTVLFFINFDVSNVLAFHLMESMRLLSIS